MYLTAFSAVRSYGERRGRHGSHERGAEITWKGERYGAHGSGSQVTQELEHGSHV